MNAADLHARATEEYARRVAAIGDDQWHLPTPCTEWDVRALVRHLVSEQAWVPPLVADGLTVAEVGDRFEGDLLGDDPVAVWDRAAKEAVAAYSAPGALERTVHLSGRDVPGERYAQELFCDLVVHGWDLSKGIGKHEEIDPELLQAAWDIGVPMLREWRRSDGIEDYFGPEIATPDDADLQTKLLAYYGRRRDWRP